MEYEDIDKIENNKIYSLGDLILEIGALVKKYESGVLLNSNDNNTNKLLDINEIINLYPQLSKHLLTKYINDGLIPVTKIGNHRYFYRKDIEILLKSKEEKKIKNNYNVENNWRNYE